MNIERCAEIFAAFSGQRLFVGYSGGADSCAALLVTAYFAKRFNFTVTAVHINHGLRGAESDREEREAENFAAQRGIPFQCFHLSGKPAGNLEAWARSERLKIWQNLAAQPGCAVVLGHHNDDRIETLFLRLLRGSNVSGLAALRCRRTVGGVIVLRPLLVFSRQEIEAFLRRNGVTHFAVDSSNADEKYLRNFFRNNILKRITEKIPHAPEFLSRSLDALAEDADFLEQTALEKYQTVRGKEFVPIRFWRELHPALQVRVLRLYLSEAAGEDIIPDGASIRRFRLEIGRESSEKRLIPLKNGKTVALQGNRLWLDHSAVADGTLPWAWQSEEVVFWSGYRLERVFAASLPPAIDEYCCCFDADEVPEFLYLTSRQDGDKMIPFGKKSAVSLKKLRIDRKIPADANLPVLRDETGTVCWACGIRHSNYAPVTENTRQILLFRCEKNRKNVIFDFFRLEK